MPPRKQDPVQHITGHQHEMLGLLRRLDRKVNILYRQGAHMAGQIDEVRAELAAAKAIAAENAATTTEIATDLDDLLTQLANGQPGSAETAAALSEAKGLTAQLAEVGTALKAAAGKHTPGGVVIPPTDPV